MLSVPTTPTLTAGGQFKRSVVGERRKKVVLGSGRRKLVVTRLVTGTAVVVVVAVERHSRASLLHITIVVVAHVVVGDVSAEVVTFWS